MLVDNLSFIDTTLFHIFIGVICGWLSQRARQEVVYPVTTSLQALLIGGWWIAHKTFEFTKEDDKLEADIFLGLFGIFVGIVLCKIYPPLLIHFFAKPKKGKADDDDS